MGQKNISLLKLITDKKSQHAISQKLIVTFTKNLSLLINSGVPLVKSLQVLAKQQRNESFRKTIESIAHEAHMGTPLSLCLMRYHKIFDNVYIQMIKAGEASSSLAEVLERIAITQERQLKLKQKIKAALVYPITVLTIACLIVSLIITLVIPKFELIFTNILNGKPLPWVTQFILSVSHSFVPLLFYTILIILLLFPLTKRLFKNKKDGITLKIPIIGKIVSQSQLGAISRVLGTLLAHGVPFIEALKVAEGVASNKKFTKMVQQLIIDIRSGKTLTESLEKEHKIISPMTRSMITVGEETGRLSVMLIQIADQLENDIQNTLEKLTAILEPLLTILLSMIIGSIVIALFIPIIDLMKNIIT